jgi:hypothetical protein
MRRGPAATADPDLLGLALARRVPLRGGGTPDPCLRDHPARPGQGGAPAGRQLALRAVPAYRCRRPRMNERMAMQ